MRGEVIKLDRSLPTVKLQDGRTLLCEHAAFLTKGSDLQSRAAIGDAVEVSIPDGHDAGIIVDILPRRTKFIRKDPAERTLPQILAANFDQVMIVQPIGELNMRRLERELVLAFETGAKVTILLTKADLADDATQLGSAEDSPDPARAAGENAAAPAPVTAAAKAALVPAPAATAPAAPAAAAKATLAPAPAAPAAVTAAPSPTSETVAGTLDAVSNLAGPDVAVLAISAKDPASIESVKQLLPAGSTTVLMGRSGVGKSTLVNALYGDDIQKTADVRSVDGKGRHITVNRQIIELPNGARIIDMPGVRGLGLWEAESGIDAAFADIEALAQSCRFRDCKHISEPGCAVLAAIADGTLSKTRYDSYINLRQEVATTEKRRQQKNWKNRR